MKSFKLFLKENFMEDGPQTGEEIVEFIKNECSQFLNDFGEQMRDEEFLYRGMSNRYPTPKIFKTNKNREPKDSDLMSHRLVDQWFDKKFGVKYRSASVFSTMDKTDAAAYGRLYLFFPIGKYTACWSNRVRDLYAWVIQVSPQSSIYNRLFAKYKNEEWWPIAREMIDLSDKEPICLYDIHHAVREHFPEIDFVCLTMDMLEYKQQPIGSYRGDSEIMINCNEYLVIHEDFHDYPDFEFHNKPSIGAYLASSL